jgi:hypothetical protein
MTKLQERISSEINMMSMDELLIVYEQIQLLHSLKQRVRKRPKSLPIETILEMTSSSPDSWAETVIEGRADRV